jgi:putative transposase
LAVILYVRFPLSLLNVEDLLHDLGFDVSHETIRFWWHRFGPMVLSSVDGSVCAGLDLSCWRSKQIAGERS